MEHKALALLAVSALGHGISDVDTGVLMEAARGSIYEAEIVAVTRGRAGTPGELSGVIRKSEGTRLGDVYSNIAFPFTSVI